MSLCVKYLKKKKIKNDNTAAAFTTSSPAERVSPAPSNGEFAPAFSTSADFDILISAEGKTQKQVSSERRQTQGADRGINVETRSDHNLDDERGKRVAGVLIGHEWRLSVFRLLTGPTCSTFIHSFQSVVEQKSRLTKGIDF